MAVSIVYMTAGSPEEAELIAKALVRQRLAACVNIIDGMRSFYEWDGAAREDREVVMIAKTRSSRLDELIGAVKALHSYDCPCIVAIEASAGNDAFLDWVEAQSTPLSPEDT